MASAYVKWYRSAEYYTTPWKGRWELDGGGALMNQAIHGVDLLQWFAGLPEEVSGWMTRRVHQGIEADDTTVASLRFPSGALGTIEATTATWPGWSRRIELCGEHGAVCLEDDRITRWDFARTEPGDERALDSAGDALGSGAGAASGISIEGHLRQFSDFVDAVREDRAPLIDGHEGRKAVALVHEHMPAAVVLDVDLPDIDGWRVLERIKSDLATRHIPVSLIATSGDALRALKLGAHSVLHGPIGSRNLLGDLLQSFQRCLTLDSRNVEVLRCLACGYVHAPTGREHGARWPRRSRVDRRLRLVDGFRRGSVNA